MQSHVSSMTVPWLRYDRQFSVKVVSAWYELLPSVCYNSNPIWWVSLYLFCSLGYFFFIRVHEQLWYVRSITLFCPEDLGRFSWQSVQLKKLNSKHEKYQPTSLLCHIMSTYLHVSQALLISLYSIVINVPDPFSYPLDIKKWHLHYHTIIWICPSVRLSVRLFHISSAVYGPIATKLGR